MLVAFRLLMLLSAGPQKPCPAAPGCSQYVRPPDDFLDVPHSTQLIQAEASGDCNCLV